MSFTWKYLYYSRAQQCILQKWDSGLPPSQRQRLNELSSQSTPEKKNHFQCEEESRKKRENLGIFPACTTIIISTYLSQYKTCPLIYYSVYLMFGIYIWSTLELNSYLTWLHLILFYFLVVTVGEVIWIFIFTIPATWVGGGRVAVFDCVCISVCLLSFVIIWKKCPQWKEL